MFKFIHELAKKTQMPGLYIGITTPGTTSQLRADTLKQVGGFDNWKIVNTDDRFRASARWAQTLAFRLRIGPAVNALNQQVLSELGNERFHVAWVDKGANLWPKTVQKIRRVCRKMVYYTPDTSFAANRSRFFEATASLYDLVVTTKSFELEHYRKLIPDDRIMLTTQSYDEQQHRPTCSFDEKRKEAVLIGLCEPDREACIEQLLNHGVPVRVGGQGWKRFLTRHRTNSLLEFEGDRVFGDHYTDTISRAAVGLGLLTKRFPELHTTRTFEIPACGTTLATPRNSETSKLFTDNEAIFFQDHAELAQELRNLLDDEQRLKSISAAGTARVRAGSFSNSCVIRQILQFGV